MTKAELSQLEDCETLAKVPKERGGVDYTEWERKFIRDMRAWNVDRDLTPAQRLTLKQLSERE